MPPSLSPRPRTLVAILASSSRAAPPLRHHVVLPGSSSSSSSRSNSSSSNSNSNSSISSSASTPPHSDDQSNVTGSAKLFADAALEESSTNSLPPSSIFQPDPTDLPWTGEERVQDRVLRMVMDKYKPLRIPAGGEDLVARKLKGVQTPSVPAASVTVMESGEEEQGESLVDALQRQGLHPPAPATATVEGPEEDGRRLPKTPDMKPWRAVYVRPSHLGGTGTPNIYYGQYLQSSSSSSSAGKGSKTMGQRLKEAGIRPSQLPLDDAKVMRKIREGVKKMERVDKLSRAREGVLDYRLGNRAAILPSSFSPHTANDGGEGEGEGDTKPREADQLLALGGGTRGWASVVEERIRAAQDAGVFKTNRLRGKPIVRDVQERNPFLDREEFFMNRIVKRQGAAPPWVELNADLEDELDKFRFRLVEAWCRRAVRMVVSSPAMREGLEALDYSSAPPTPSPPPTSSALEEEVSPFARERQREPTPLSSKTYAFLPQPRTEGERRLLSLASSYRDAEWVERERSYHLHEIQRLNELVRRHNHLAPFHARRGLLTLDRELGELYKRARPELVRRLSAALNDAGGNGMGGSRVEKEERRATRDVWGRVVMTQAGAAGGRVSREEEGGGVTRLSGVAVAVVAERRRKRPTSMDRTVVVACHRRRSACSSRFAAPWRGQKSVSACSQPAASRR